MGLVFKRTTRNSARKYERSSGMEPNPGVSHLAVVHNPGRRSRKSTKNPFQWIEGRGQRHQHVSKPYDGIKGAVGWKKRHPGSSARLYPVDERGTVVSRPVSKKLLGNRRSTGMAGYNMAALRRAMRSNGMDVSEAETSRGVRVRSNGRKRRKTTGGKRRKTTRNPRYVVMNRRRRSRKASTSRRKTGRRVTANRRRARRRTTANRRSTKRRKSRRSSRNPRYVVMNRRRRRTRRNTKYATANRRGSRRRRSRRAVAANRRSSRRRSSRRRVTANRRSSRRRRTRRNPATSKYAKGWGRVFGKKSTRKSSRKAAAPKARRSSRKAAAPKARRSSRRAAPKASRRGGTRRRRAASRRGGKRRATGGYYWGRKRVSRRGKEYLDKYLSRGFLPTVAPLYRQGGSRSGRPAVLVYPAAAGQGRLSRRASKRRVSYRRKGTTRRRKSYALGASYRGGRARKMAANRRRRSRRASVRRNSRRSSRRSSRRGSRRRLTRNLLSTSKVQWGSGPGGRTGRPRGKKFQVVLYGSKSKRGRKVTVRRGKAAGKTYTRRTSGYPVYVPGHVVERGMVRKYRFGGAAKDAHRRARTSGYKERKTYAKRRRVTKNRRSSMRRNPRYVVMNKRRRRRGVRRNQAFFGADLMKDVLTPVLGGTVGFVGARVLSNGLANVAFVRNILDRDRSAADAENTKLAANLLGIAATIGLGTQIPMIRRNQGSLITGMGLALADRLLGRIGGDASAYLSGFGEYVSQPLGEYVSQPLGAYVEDPSMGEYVSQPLGGVGDYAKLPSWQGYDYATAGVGQYAEGIDPANQAGIDRTMDAMEGGMPAMQAAAGMGNTLYAAAGLGTLYAAAGLGAEADASLRRMYAREQPPFASDFTPTDMALNVTAEMPYGRAVPESMVTPEGKGYAGGLFARNVFAGMF